MALQKLLGEILKEKEKEQKGAEQVLSEDNRENTALPTEDSHYSGNASESADERLSNEQTYDSALSAMVTKLRGFIVPLVNEAFGESFSINAAVEIENNKHIVRHEDGSLDRRETDLYVKLSEFVGQMVTKFYHFECEAWYDDSIIVRIAEYASVIAADAAEITNDGVVLTYPHSAVIFLHPRDGIPSVMKITIRVPGGAEASYDVPALQIKDYTIDDIFEKKLLILLPFYLFRFDAEFEEMEKDADKLKAMQEVLSETGTRLENLVRANEISMYQYRTVLDLLKRVSDRLTVKYKNVRKGVDEIMSGYIARTEADDILEQGQRQGLEQGLEQGLAQGLAQGLEQGLEQGQQETLALMDFLWSNGRADEAQRASKDRDLFQSLLAEFRADTLAAASE